MCVWCGLQLSDAAIRLDTGPPTLPSEPLPTQHAGGEPKGPTIQAQEHAGETEAPSANSEALLQRYAAVPPGSSDAREQMPKTFGWLLLVAGGAFLVTGFVAGRGLIFLSGLDAWSLPTIVITLLNAGCGAALVMEGTRRITAWSHVRVSAVGFTSFLMPLPFLFFPFSLFFAALVESIIRWVIGFEAALLILQSVVDEVPFSNSHKQLARSVLGKLQYVTLPMIGVAAWILVPQASGLLREVEEGMLWAIYPCSIGIMSGLLAAIWVTSKTHKFVHQIIAVLILFALNALCSLYWIFITK